MALDGEKMVERVAGAMFEYAQQHESPLMQSSWIDYAREAIRAACELTPMDVNTCPMEPTQDRLRYYRAMLDAALGEGPP